MGTLKELPAGSSQGCGIPRLFPSLMRLVSTPHANRGGSAPSIPPLLRRPVWTQAQVIVIGYASDSPMRIGEGGSRECFGLNLVAAGHLGDLESEHMLATAPLNPEPHPWKCESHLGRAAVTRTVAGVGVSAFSGFATGTSSGWRSSAASDLPIGQVARDGGSGISCRCSYCFRWGKHRVGVPCPSRPRSRNLEAYGI